jgi:transposase-like protein
MNLIDVNKKFATEEQCLNYLVAMRWPDGVRCMTCGNDKVSVVERKAASKNRRNRFFVCLESTCKAQFSATTGTMFHDSHLPLNSWFLAIALITNAKKGLSAKQLQRDLGIGSYQTAWYLYHRIRKAMVDPNEPKLSGTVEIDEVYLGGRVKGRKNRWRNKDAVIGMRQRGGPLKLVQVPDTKIGTVYDVIAANVGNDVTAVMTDESAIYAFKMTQYENKHKRINHSKGKYVKYLRGGEIIHTNTVESSFSLLRRGIIGNFHIISIKHLQNYLNEFCYRFNRREIKDLFEQTVRRLTNESPMQYKQLTAPTS